MSGKRTEINFFETFNLFVDEESKQYWFLKNIFINQGINLRIPIKNADPFLGFFGESSTYEHLDYKFSGLSAVLLHSSFFSSYIQKNEVISSSKISLRGSLNKILLFDDDNLEITIFSEKISESFSSNWWDLRFKSLPISNPQLTIEILNQGYVDINITLLKSEETKRENFEYNLTPENLMVEIFNLNLITMYTSIHKNERNRGAFLERLFKSPIIYEEFKNVLVKLEFFTSKYKGRRDALYIQCAFATFLYYNKVKLPMDDLDKIFIEIDNFYNKELAQIQVFNNRVLKSDLKVE